MEWHQVPKASCEPLDQTLPKTFILWPFQLSESIHFSSPLHEFELGFLISALKKVLCDYSGHLLFIESEERKPWCPPPIFCFIYLFIFILILSQLSSHSLNGNGYHSH